MGKWIHLVSPARICSNNVYHVTKRAFKARYIMVHSITGSNNVALVTKRPLKARYIYNMESNADELCFGIANGNMESINLFTV